MPNTSIFTRFWIWLTGEAKELPVIENTIINFVDKVTDDIKVIEASDLPKYLEGLGTLAESFDPALTPLISGIELYIPKAIGLITGVLDDVVAALTRLQSIKSEDAVIYAGNLGTLQAGLSNYVLSNNAATTGVLSPPPGQLLAIGQVVHSANGVKMLAGSMPLQNQASPKETEEQTQGLNKAADEEESTGTQTEEKGTQQADDDMQISNEAKEQLAAGSGITGENDKEEPFQGNTPSFDEIAAKEAAEANKKPPVV